MAHKIVIRGYVTHGSDVYFVLSIPHSGLLLSLICKEITNLHHYILAPHLPLHTICHHLQQLELNLLDHLASTNDSLSGLHFPQNYSQYSLLLVQC
jgi:hypothetical protein